MFRAVLSHPSGTLRYDGTVGPRPLEVMVWDVPGSPVSAAVEWNSPEGINGRY